MTRMIVTVPDLTPALARMLRTRNDDGTPPLIVLANAAPGHAHQVEITRADGSELSEFETRHVRATLAANAAEPIR